MSGQAGNNRWNNALEWLPPKLLFSLAKNPKPNRL
jgi:hypothetical protein